MADEDEAATVAAVWFCAAGERRLPIVGPMLGLVVATVLLVCANADLRLEASFYDPSTQSFPQLEAAGWRFLYHWGCYPALLLAIGGGVVWLVGAIRSDCHRWGRAGLFLGLTMLVGPGLLVNLLVKPLMARPRPNQVTQFGGAHAFVQPFTPGVHDKTYSFPSGHATMGFFLMVPAFLFVRTRPRLAWTILMLGISYGLLMGLARMAQGRHFATDVLWAGGCVYLAAWFVDRYLPRTTTPQAALVSSPQPTATLRRAA